MLLHRVAGLHAQFIARPAVPLGFQQDSFLPVNWQSGDRGMGRPREAGDAVLDGHASRDRGVAIEHFRRERAFAHLRERLAEAILAGIQQVADPPRPRALAPQRELQRPTPFREVGLSRDAHADRSEMEWSDRNFWRRRHKCIACYEFNRGRAT